MSNNLRSLPKKYRWLKPLLEKFDGSSWYTPLFYRRASSYEAEEKFFSSLKKVEFCDLRPVIREILKNSQVINYSPLIIHGILEQFGAQELLEIFHKKPGFKSFLHSLDWAVCYFEDFGMVVPLFYKELVTLFSRELILSMLNELKVFRSKQKRWTLPLSLHYLGWYQIFEINDLRHVEDIITSKAPNVLDYRLFEEDYARVISSVKKIIRMKEQKNNLDKEIYNQKKEKMSIIEIKQEIDSILQLLYFRRREKMYNGDEQEMKGSGKRKLSEDISFSHNADIYVVTLFADETWSCTCSLWNKKHQECAHIRQYKTSYFDPSWIPDALDHYRWLDHLNIEAFTFGEFVDEFPRWVIEYLFEEYEYRELDSLLCTSPFNIEKICYALHRYREIEKMKK